MKRVTAFLTDVEKKVFEFLASAVMPIEIEKNKPPVNRIGMQNGALKQLLGTISSNHEEAYEFLDIFFGKLERAGMIMKIGSRHDDKRIPILQVPVDLSKVKVVEVAKPQEDIMGEPKAEITIERLQARVLELRQATQGGTEEIDALKREINAKISNGEGLDCGLVDRYNLLINQPPKPPEELAILHQRLEAFELVIKDLTGQECVDVQPTGEKLGAVKQKKTGGSSEEEKLARAWFNFARDPSEWVSSGRIAEVVVKDKTFKTISHVRSILSSSATQVQRNPMAGKFRGLFETRELNGSDRGKYDPRVRLLYRLSKAGEQFISEYTAKK